MSLVPLFLISILFIAFSLPPYLTLDPARSRVPQLDDFALHYPILVAHVLFGSVALLTACLQVWPWVVTLLVAEWWLERDTWTASRARGPVALAAAQP